METNTLKALKWIVGILNANSIPYRIGGGLATHLYGSRRPVNDIDISLSGKYFSVLVPILKEYISAGPKHYKNEKWDCTTLSLSYDRQEIDMTDVDTLLMSNKDKTAWIKNKAIYQKHPDVEMDADGIKVSLMDPRVLLEYKSELDGEQQELDVAFLRDYIKARGL